MFVLDTVQPAGLVLLHLTPGFGWLLPSPGSAEGLLPARGAESSTGLSVWDAGWCLWDWEALPSHSLCPKLAGWLWLSFFMSLWSNSFSVEVGKSLSNLLENSTLNSRLVLSSCAGRSWVWVTVADMPVDGGMAGRGSFLQRRDRWMSPLYATLP